MASLNRTTVREALAASLETALVGVGLPAQAVYNYQVGDFGTQNPVVVVTSRGTDRVKDSGTFDGMFATNVLLNVFVFCLYTEVDDGGTIVMTEQQSEDRLDLIEAEIADQLLADPSLGGVVDEVLPDGATEVTSAVLGGKEYRVERIPVIARNAHG